MSKTKKKQSVSQRLRDEFGKIHPQWTLPAAIFLALRGRHERKCSVDGALQAKDRIGKVFPNGDIGVVIFGDRGTRKTTLMRSIHQGLGLDGMDSGSGGEPMAHFFDSAGMATSVGLLDLFSEHSDSVLFLDEMDWDNPGHFALFKQVANGKLYRQKHGSTEPIDFSSLVVASTNSISMPTKKSDKQHLLAVLDRFYVLKARPVTTNMHEIIDSVFDFDQRVDDVDWDYLRECLTRQDYSALNDRERALVHEIAKEKERLIFGADRDQTRNVFKMLDAVLFFKRLLGLDDVTQHEDVVQCIIELIDAIIIFNPGTVISLKDELDQMLYDSVADNDSEDSNGVKFSVIKKACESRGMVIEESQRRQIIRRLDSLVMSGMIIKLSKGKYSIRKSRHKTQSDEPLAMSPMAGSL